MLKSWLYPVLLGSVSLVAYLTIHNGWDYGRTYAAVTLVLVALLITLERISPLRRDWGMNRFSFVRDLKYISLVAPTIALIRTGAGLVAIHLSTRYTGPMKEAPALLGVVAFLVTFEFFQYWVHRLSHEGRGRVGALLWKTHVAHHLPDRVYVVMHAVFNPINALINATIIQGTMIGLGISPEAAFVSMLLIDLQGLVSHFNFDLRLGPLAYVFMGTETHRYHHSADLEEAKNFGVTLTLWDLVFGTFRYQPGVHPKRLGVDQPGEYPSSHQTWQVISLPFSKRVKPTS
jgi:sterol desaturase/sphingolipid hydroxylase (fatty acid hydroxylase superfamily)